MSQPNKPSKRKFIAGASCPKCHQLDKIYLLKEGSETVVMCSQCGYKDYKTNSSEDIDTVRLPQS